MRRVVYRGNEWVLTTRELLFSIIIVLFMLAGGFLIGEKISSANDNANQEYDQAVKIDVDKELFEYGMRTSVGHAFVSGTLKAVDPVTYPELNGEYACVEKVKEKYTQHTRQVPHTRTVNGKSQTYYTTETYWTWDKVGEEHIHCTTISFLDVEFSHGTIEFPDLYLIDTIKQSSKIRYKYYGYNTSYDGTLYADLRDNTISDTTFVNNANIDEAVKYMHQSRTILLVIFWIVWIAVIGGAVYGFCYLDNRWLED